MKKIFGLLLLCLGLSLTAAAQNGLNNVIIQRSGSGSSFDTHVILAGPGANNVTEVSVIFDDGTQSRVSTTYVPLTGGTGASWSGSATTSSGIDQSFLNDGIITIKQQNGSSSQWRFGWGTGNRSATGSVSHKAELL